MNNIKSFGAAKALFILAVFSSLLSLQELSAQTRRPATGARPTTGARPATKPAATKPAVNKPATNNRSVGNKTNNVNNSGNRTNNVGSNNKNVNINIDNSKDVRINNSRNTVVRHNPRPYPRPPYVYGGFHYRCYHPYYFHPYRPFVWGPMWHPWGFFITTLAVTAIIVTVDNIEPQFDLDVAMVSPYSGNNALYAIDPNIHGPFFAPYAGSPGDYFEREETPVVDEYWYDEGVFYLKGDGGYTVVSAPIGAKIKTLPKGYETITLDDNTKNYYYGATFYEKTSSGYTVVAPIAGAVVTNVSEGGEELKLGDVTYVKLGETYYQPIQENGKNMNEVVDVEEAK